MKNFAQSHIQAMHNYQPPLEPRLEYPGSLLDFNEKTLPPSQAIKQALQMVIDKNIIQIYPEECLELKEKIAEYCGVQPNQVLLTNGSDQGIDVVFRTFTQANDQVIIPTPSYSLFYLFAELAQANIVQPLLNAEDLSFPIQSVLKATTLDTALTIVCSPNNPTGQIVDNNTIQQLADKTTNGIVFVDEAYYEFSGYTAVELLKQYPNVVISRTFSKAFGLAGLRIGYIIASAEHIVEMEKVRNPYDINIFAYYGARAALDNLAELQEYVDEVMTIAKPKTEQFFRDNTITFYPSQANFILFRPANNQAVYETLRAAGILVRTRSGSLIDGTIRLTIGTVAQMEEFIRVYKEKCI